jgi:phospholipid/cholesterol/gamma-HCH transport system substrate-binding protein
MSNYSAMATDQKKAELLVGAFCFVGLLLLGALILQFGRFGDRFHESYRLTLLVDDAAGIIKGSEVRMGGAKIGRVARAPFLTEDVNVQIDLLIGSRYRIPEGSSLGVASVSFIGDKMIIVTPPEKQTGTFIPPNRIIRGTGPSGLDAIQSNAEILSRDARKLMDGATATLQKVDAAVSEITVTSQELTKTIKKVNESILKPENVTLIDQAIQNVSSSTEQWKKVSDDLPAAMHDARVAIQAMEKAATGAVNTLGKIDQRVDDLGPTLEELPKATKAIAQAAVKANETMDHVVKGGGLLGTLTHDDEVSADAKAFIRNLKERGILRYQDSEPLHPEDDPRNRFRGKRR